MLNLGGERQADRALPPFEEVGEPARTDAHVRVGFYLERLAGQRAAVRASHQGDALRRFAPLGSAGRRAVGVAQSNERPAAEVRDEKGNLRGAKRVREA